MASTIDGGYIERYGIELEYDYNGLYSRFVDKIYFRGVSEYVINEFGISIKKEFVKNFRYRNYNSLEKHYNPEDVENLNMDNIIRKLLLQKNTSHEICFISNEDIILCEREAKLAKLKKQIKEENSIKNKIKKLFK